MSIRFAGSRFVHERRRRRLAQECGGVSLVPVDDDAAPRPFDDEALLPATTTLGHSPVSSIIRPQLWVHWTITVLCLAAWGGMMYLGDLTERTDVGLRDILGIRSGRLTNFFSTIMLLWATQLALLIYWYRRKSRNDFAGRYRMWLWIGGLLQLFLIVVATGAHRPFAAYMQRMWPLNIPMYGLLSWLVPTSTLALALYRLLRIELKRHRSGKFLLTLAGLAALTTAASLVVGRFLPDRVRDLVQVGSATLAHLCLATALLMHARYVVHISNEVPRRERRTRRLLAAARNAAGHLPLPKVPRFGWPKLSLPKLSFRKLSRPKLSVPRLSLPKLSLPKLNMPKVSLPKIRLPERSTSEASPAPSEIADKSKQVVKAQPSPAKAKASTKEQRPAVETRAVMTSRKTNRSASASEPRHRIDAAQTPKGPRKPPKRSLDDILNEYGADEEIDSQTLGELSKKERRRLRKKQRELQRISR